MNTQLMHFQLTLSYSLLCLISEEGNICLVNILYSKSTLRRITEIYILDRENQFHIAYSQICFFM
jgi:hypothetical protein